jgi:hypothetical protein
LSRHNHLNQHRARLNLKQKSHIMKLILKATSILCCHRALYGGMAGSYGWAATQSHDLGVYITLAALHAILAIKG